MFDGKSQSLETCILVWNAFVPTRGNFLCEIYVVPRDKTQHLNEAGFFHSRENKQQFGLNDEIKRTFEKSRPSFASTNFYNQGS